MRGAAGAGGGGAVQWCVLEQANPEKKKMNG